MKNELLMICDKLSSRYTSDEGFQVLKAEKVDGHWVLEIVQETKDQEQNDDSDK